MHSITETGDMAYGAPRKRRLVPAPMSQDNTVAAGAEPLDFDARPVDEGITVFVEVRLNVQDEGRRHSFEQAVLRWPEVADCFVMTGDADYLLRVEASDVRAYHRFLDGTLRQIKGVLATKSSIAMRLVKHSSRPARPRPVNRRSVVRPLRPPAK